MRFAWVLALFPALCACGSDDSSGSAGVDAAVEGGGGSGGSSASGGSAGSGGNAGGGGSAGSSGSAGADAGTDAAPVVCDFAAPVPAALPVLWASPLSGTGDQTLGGHGHNDGNGPVGHCPGTPVAGQPFYRLIAAGFETDDNIGKGPLPVDFWKDATSFDGVGESGGRVNIYVQIVDQNGTVLNVDSNPEIHVDVETLGGGTQTFPLTSKPTNEFQTNFPMTGGGNRYGISIQGASDRVINMRLPVNHHVCYILIFRRET